MSASFAGGRPPKPTALKLLQGSKKTGRMDPKEPKLKRARLEPPANFPEAAKETWREIAGILHGMQVLTTADPLALEQFSLTLADYREARAALRERDGFTYEVVSNTGSSVWKPWPELALISDLERRCLHFFSRFGMTPSDRTRVRALDGDADENPFTAV